MPENVILLLAQGKAIHKQDWGNWQNCECDCIITSCYTVT